MLVQVQFLLAPCRPATMISSKLCHRLQLQACGAAAVLVLLMVMPRPATASAVRASRALGNLPMAVSATNVQHVQFTVSVQGQTCSSLQASGQSFADRFRGAMRLDVLALLTANQQTDAVATVKSGADACVDIQVSQGWCHRCNCGTAIYCGLLRSTPCAHDICKRPFWGLQGSRLLCHSTVLAP